MVQAVKLNIVRDGGTANKAGLVAGDILYFYGPAELNGPEALTRAISQNTGESCLVFTRHDVIYQTMIPAGAMDVAFAMIEAPDVNPKHANPHRPLTPDEATAERARQLAGIVLTTTPGVQGYRIVKQLGIVGAECAFGMNLFRDLFAQLTDIFGGRSGSTQNLLHQARETCLNELRQEALEKGANAVVGVALDFSEFSGQGKSMLFLATSGTAVVIEEDT